MVFVSHRENLVDAARDSFESGDLHWINGAPEEGPVQLKLRHGPELVDGEIRCRNGGSRLSVRMAEADRGVAPGQFSVFYRGDVCLGAGRILEA